MRRVPSYPIDVARARMAVAPKGVAQNVVSVFLEMARDPHPAALGRICSCFRPRERLRLLCLAASEHGRLARVTCER